MDNAKKHEKRIKFLSEPFKIGIETGDKFEDPFGNRLGITDYNK